MMGNKNTMEPTRIRINRWNNILGTIISNKNIIGEEINKSNNQINILSNL